MGYLAGTPLDLERCLVRVITEWVQDFRLKSPIDRGAVPVPIQVYQGFVESYYAGPEEPAQDKAPSISVRCTSGFYVRERGKATANIMILCWDDDVRRVGYQDCLNVMTHIRFHLQEEVGIGAGDPRYSNHRNFVLADDPIHFMEVVDPFKDFFPYFVCGLECQFYVPSSTPPPPYPAKPELTLQGGTEGWTEIAPAPSKSNGDAK